MRRFCFIVLLTIAVAGRAAAQIDIEHRRTLTFATEFALNGEEAVSPFGLFWFNEANFPWTNTALRVLFAGLYLDGELSYFVGGNTNTAIGIGSGGGVYVDNIYPYADGERIAHQQFYGDNVNARLFINQTIPNPTPLPLNVRGTYQISGSFYRDTSSTKNFTLPSDFLTQTALAELRFGGIEPGLTTRRGAELYVAAEANYRTGFEAFGPTRAEFPAENKYERVYGSLSAKLPFGRATAYARVGGGLGEHLDELSSYKIGGNLLGFDAYSYPLHGYYTREFFADDFGIANLEFRYLLDEKRHLTAHLYGDWAVIKPVPPQPSDWNNFFGVGAGVGFRAFWGIDMLVNYGYGFNAVRNAHLGGHEAAWALEKQF